MTKLTVMLFQTCVAVIFCLALGFRPAPGTSMPSDNDLTQAESGIGNDQSMLVTRLFGSELYAGPESSISSLSLLLTESVNLDTMRNGMRSCPVGQFIVGIDMDLNRILCSNQPVLNSAAPYTAAFEITDTTTFSQGLKACPAGYGMTGLNVAQKKVSCAHVGKLEPAISSTIRRSNTNACPEGRVMIGFDDDSNRVLCGRRVDSCFGALGSRCGITSEGFETAGALCLNNQCLTNAGSWAHDECCWDFPNGKWCRNVTANHDGRCVTELSTALSRLAAGYNWKTNINFLVQNLHGTVVRETFCAPPGTIVHRNDVNRCCSGNARMMASATSDPIQATADLTKATQQGITTELTTSNPRVCR
jgi:hypothetical protein